MKLSIKKMLTMFLVIALMFTFAVPCFATDGDDDETEKPKAGEHIDVGSIEITYPDPEQTNDIKEKAGAIVGLITNIAIVASLVLIAILGVKYMLGSAAEKAGYQKSFVPLVVGAAVVMSASAIAKLIFSIL